MMIKSSEISIILQGPIYKDITHQVCYRMRQIFPNSQIILSTWEGSDVKELEFDVLVLNKDPGGTPLMIDDINGATSNLDRMILSTKNGLKKVSRKYTLRWRTDCLLKNDKFLSFFDKYEKRCAEWKIFKKRVLVHYPTLPYVYPLGPTDISCFGLTEDIKIYWDLPLQPKGDSTYFITNNYPDDLLINIQKIAQKRGSEMYIWYNVLKKYEDKYGRIPSRFGFDFNYEILRISELSFANNLQVLSRKDFDFQPLAHPYLLAQTKHSVFPDLWLYYYKKYCICSIPFYDFKYYVYYPIKLLLYKFKYIIPLRRMLKNILCFHFIKAAKCYRIYKNLFYINDNNV